VPLTAAAEPPSPQQHIPYTYCTQLLIKGSDLPIDKIREHLSHTPPGDSLLVVGDETLIKIHFHNDEPGQVLQYCGQFGELSDIVIDNMREQAEHKDDFSRFDAPAPPPVVKRSGTAVIAVCAGEGIAAIYRDLGAAVISGGQTMNPSAEDILNAVEQTGAEQVVILPNNSNIILTATQVKELSELPVEVVPSKYVTQGIAAMLGFNAQAPAAENAAAMLPLLDSVVNGELTFAIRDSKYNGFEIKEGDVLALLDGNIIAHGKQLNKMLDALLKHMTKDNDNASLICLYWGEGVDEQQAEAAAARLAKKYSDYDVEVHYGGQPLYYYLLSVE
ncbi:MAG: hypothetical protein Q4B96_05065, partial [Bacillota bacterium]|nr:hypothetical protein [Bacillota bacterium]